MPVDLTQDLREAQQLACRLTSPGGADAEVAASWVNAEARRAWLAAEAPAPSVDALATAGVLVKNESGAGEYTDNPPRRWWSPYVATDWPGVLCSTCDSRFRDGGYTSLIDFRFSRNPKCPNCLAQRTREAAFGLPVSSAVYCSTPLWVDWRGCCVDHNVWSCAECGHQWG